MRKIITYIYTCIFLACGLFGASEESVFTISADNLEKFGASEESVFTISADNLEKYLQKKAIFNPAIFNPSNSKKVKTKKIEYDEARNEYMTAKTNFIDDLKSKVVYDAFKIQRVEEAMKKFKQILKKGGARGTEYHTIKGEYISALEEIVRESKRTYYQAKSKYERIRKDYFNELYIAIGKNAYSEEGNKDSHVNTENYIRNLRLEKLIKEDLGDFLRNIINEINELSEKDKILRLLNDENNLNYLLISNYYPIRHSQRI